MSVLVVGLTCPFGSLYVIVADVRGVDPPLIGAVGAQGVVDGHDQARADPVGRGRDGCAKRIAERAGDERRGDRRWASWRSSPC